VPDGASDNQAKRHAPTLRHWLEGRRPIPRMVVRLIEVWRDVYGAACNGAGK
jgi:hypothetical protein